MEAKKNRGGRPKGKSVEAVLRIIRENRGDPYTLRSAPQFQRLVLVSDLLYMSIEDLGGIGEMIEGDPITEDRDKPRPETLHDRLWRRPRFGFTQGDVDTQIAERYRSPHGSLEHSARDLLSCIAFHGVEPKATASDKADAALAGTERILRELDAIRNMVDRLRRLNLFVEEEESESHPHMLFCWAGNALAQGADSLSKVVAVLRQRKPKADVVFGGRPIRGWKHVLALAFRAIVDTVAPDAKPSDVNLAFVAVLNRSGVGAMKAESVAQHASRAKTAIENGNRPEVVALFDRFREDFRTLPKVARRDN